MTAYSVNCVAYSPDRLLILVRQHADDIAAGFLIALEFQHVPGLRFFQQRVE